MIRECFLIIVIRIPQGERWNQTAVGLFAECRGMLGRGAGLSRFRGLSEAVPAGYVGRLAYPFRHLSFFKAVFVDVKPARVFVLA